MPAFENGAMTRRLRTFLLVRVVVALVGAAASLDAQTNRLKALPNEAKGKRAVRVFIVAGQSNAEGHNHIGQYHGGQEAFPLAVTMQ